VQFFQDAHILGRLLSHPAVNKTNLNTALKVYQSVRLPFASSIVERSRETGFIYEFNSPGLEWEDDANMKPSTEKIVQAVYDQWSWQWEKTPDMDWAQAEKLLYEMLQPRSKREYRL